MFRFDLIQNRLPCLSQKRFANPIGRKSVCNEWCSYQAKYDNCTGMQSYSFKQTLHGIIGGTVTEIPQSAAVLLSRAVCEDPGHMHARSDDDIRESVRDVVTEAASKRSSDRFEVW